MVLFGVFKCGKKPLLPLLLSAFHSRLGHPEQRLINPFRGRAREDNRCYWCNFSTDKSCIKQRSVCLSLSMIRACKRLHKEPVVELLLQQENSYLLFCCSNVNEPLNCT